MNPSCTPWNMLVLTTAFFSLISLVQSENGTIDGENDEDDK